MPITETTSPAFAGKKLRRGFRFALIGLIFGFIGLGIATYRMSIDSETPPPPKSKEVSDVLSDTLKKTADKLRKKDPITEPLAPRPPMVEWPISKKLGLGASICGFIGAAFGCVSWLYGEHRRWTLAALCVGVAALAWTYVIVAVAIAAAIAIGITILSFL